jgi:hypothetical protein
MESCRKIEEMCNCVMKFNFFLIFFIINFLFGENNVVFLPVNYSNLEY